MKDFFNSIHRYMLNCKINAYEFIAVIAITDLVVSPFFTWLFAK